MRVSQLFGKTLRDAPAEADTAGHALLVRAGYIRPLGAGIFSYLHLARRSMTKIENILREEMDRIGGQEITMPVVQPADLWKESGRWYKIGAEMARFTDRNEHDMVLAMTHEEALSDLVRREVQSYKDLPRLVYHIQTKFRDEPRARAGLIRVREFTMKDSYSLDADWEGLERQYRSHYQAYFNIFNRCGLDVIAVMADPGMMGGKISHEYMYINPIGEDTLILCDQCGYSANRQVAVFEKKAAEDEAAKPLEKVHTPACKSIEELANFLGIAKSKTAKAVFFMATIPEEMKKPNQNSLEALSGSSSTAGTAPASAESPAPKDRKIATGAAEEKFIFAVIRGDMELNETKLAQAVGARDLRPATEEEILAVGAVPGYASPVGLPAVGDPARAGMLIVIDDSILSSPNLAAGANESDYHLLNTNTPRDYAADLVTDIAAAEAGFSCRNCGSPLRTARGVEVGNIFQLGTYYSDSLGCTYLDKNGESKPVIMGSYGIGVGRLLACIAEEHHDEHGLALPISVAPFQVQMVLLRGKNAPQVEETSLKLYNDLQQAGIEVLFDDREESPGVKFNDADLIGLPLRLTVSERALAQGGIEFKLRTAAEKTIVPLEETISKARSILESLFSEIAARVLPVTYQE